MSKRVLITGGAGFVGSFVADELLGHGYQVRVLDALDTQVHPEQERPEYLHRDVELINGDIRDRDAVQRALRGCDAVFHLAALVGVGQSMYQIERYTSVNNVGTAILLETLADQPVERIVVASSMSIYGEGLYQAVDGSLVPGGERSLAQLTARQWELVDQAGEVLQPVPTPETKIPALASVYALSKFDQERLCLMAAKAYGFAGVALRFFNIYGPRQALSNPYTGVMAIFASRLLNERPPLINEDGNQLRDFVHVSDIARACRLALETPEAAGEVFNVGSGEPRSVLQVARALARSLDKDGIEPEIVGKYRVGDIRHCFADITKARDILGYAPQIGFDQGVAQLAQWLAGQEAQDNSAVAGAELAARGLAV